MAEGLAINSAPGMTYRSFPGLDRRFFRCVAHEAALSVEACAGMHVEAQTATGDRADRLVAFRPCPIGAAHAHRPLVHYSPLYGSLICPRCGKGTTRMILWRKCVNCYNRQRELLAGRNAKGAAPSQMLPLVAVEVSYTVDGNARRYHSQRATGRAEVMAPASYGARAEVRVSGEPRPAAPGSAAMILKTVGLTGASSCRRNTA